MPNDVAAVLYLINDAQLLIFTVTNEKISIKITELKEDINKTLSNFISVLNVPGKSSGTGTLTLRSTILSERKAPSGISAPGGWQSNRTRERGDGAGATNAGIAGVC